MTVAFRSRRQASPGSPQKDHPQTQSQTHARHVLRRVGAAPRVPVAAEELAGQASLPLVAGRTRHAAPRSPRRAPPGPSEHLLEKDTSRAEICALGPRFPRPPERFQTRPLLGPPRAVRATSSGDSRRPGPAPGFPATPLSSYGLPVPKTVLLGPPGRLASVASTSSDPSQPSPIHASLGGGTVPPWAPLGHASLGEGSVPHWAPLISALSLCS